MAKQGGSESTRSRVPPPPRMTGLGTAQVAIVGGLFALLIATLGVYLGGSRHDPMVEERMDALGGGAVALLTAPAPEGWSKDNDSWIEAWREIQKPLPDDIKLPALPSKFLGLMQSEDFKRGEANQARWERIYNALDNWLPGVLKGVYIRFSPELKIKPFQAGARIDPDRFQAARRIGRAQLISVGLTAGEMTGGVPFTARVYHKEYRDRKDQRVGDAYVILAEDLVTASGGAGIWMILTPLLVALAVAGIILFANKTQAGIREVARDLDTIGRGKLDLRIATAGSGEVAFLKRSVDRMAKNLALIQTTGSGDLDEAIEKELDLASQIHQSLRPLDPPRIPGYELETLFKPGRDIGGDYFDYVDLDEKRIALVIADCSENLRGVPAAMVMAMTRAYLKTAADPNEGPADWLKWVNRRLARDLKSGMAVTALVVVADTSSGEMVAASAGHRPIVLWRQGKIATINPNGIALGLDIGPVFEKTIEEKRFSMQKNDRIVLYTDGVVLAKNDGGDEYGEQRFHESIRRQGAMNSAAFVNFVAGGVDQFLGGAEQMDDLTVSTLKRMK